MSTKISNAVLDIQNKGLRDMTSFIEERMQQVLSKDPHLVALNDLPLFYAERAGALQGLLQALIETNKYASMQIDILNNIKNDSND